MYTITLNDGTKLENLELNGNNYIAEGIVDDAVFEDNLDRVTISDGETTETYEDMFLVCNRVEKGRSWIVLAEKTDQMKKEEAVNKILTANANDVTAVQMALVELYELILGG